MHRGQNLSLREPAGVRSAKSGKARPALVGRRRRILDAPSARGTPPPTLGL